MGWDGHKLTAPFTKIALNGQGDLQRALGVSSTGMTQANLFANGNINKWAKYKAFKNSIVYTDHYSDTNSQRKAGLIANNYGFGTGFVDGTTVFTSKGTLHSGFANQWTYYRPTIGDGYLRALDFEGYVGDDAWGMIKYTDAAGNIQLFGPFGVYVSCPSVVGTGTEIYFGIEADSSGAADGLLSLSDFASLSGTGFFDFGTWYPGVALLHKTNSNYDRYVTMDEAASHNRETFFTIPSVSDSNSPASSALHTGDYYIVPILAQQKAITLTSTFPTKVVTLDGWYQELSASLSASALSWGITGMPTKSGNNLIATVKITNKTGNNITFNSLFSYTMTDKTSESLDYYSALNDACQNWVNSPHTENTAGVKNSSNEVIAVYKSHRSSNFTVNAGASTEISCTVATTANDALGNAYDEYADIRFCLKHSNNTYLCNKIY